MGIKLVPEQIEVTIPVFKDSDGDFWVFDLESFIRAALDVEKSIYLTRRKSTVEAGVAYMIDQGYLRQLTKLEEAIHKYTDEIVPTISYIEEQDKVRELLAELDSAVRKELCG